ncbi:L-type lectin-domain containing receptor kinase S.6-like [Hibiscus syriacus]|uniref:L-type lectin-domain containing receptor kinase S.6-like n=1 Tax=Hibiscus syriacus TaxID=106335 RepID=UPI0019225E10|nr:L-type lectin-domain containing receptor kinase S.6-like [Hibiscus syriacus]
MLDDEFNAKLGDFGLVEVYEHCCASRDATIPAGTIGYLAPEYVYTGVPTVKTDVYSFRVVVLEVATGKRPVDENGTVLVDWIWDLWVKKKLIEGVDSGMLCRYNVLEMERLFVRTPWMHGWMLHSIKSFQRYASGSLVRKQKKKMEEKMKEEIFVWNFLENGKRMEKYYRRNYKDYFEFVEGTLKGKKEQELSEAEKGILDWLKANK